MRIIILLFIVAISINNVDGQVTCSANLGSGSGYAVIENSGFGIETPDCKHTDFGPHITQIYDSVINKYVFEFHSHIIEDDDRCINDDRVRIEIKGGPTSPTELHHVENSTSYYRWKFMLDKDFKGSSSFCHIFQNKAYGGNDVGMPLITITPRESTLQIIHDGGDTGKSLGKVKEVSLAPFLGKWVEGYIKQVHSEEGSIEITLKDLETGNLILSYSNDNLDMWRISSEYNRPKWGVYRSRRSDLQDEIVRFADFCVSENSSDLCPSDSLNGISEWFSARPELKQENDSTFIMSFTQPLSTGQISEDKIVIGGNAGVEQTTFKVMLHSDNEVSIAFSNIGILPTFSTITAQAKNITSTAGNQLKGSTTSTYIEPDKRPVVTGTEVTIDNVTGLVTASSTKLGHVYLIMYGLAPQTISDLDSLITIDKGRGSEVLQVNESIPIYATGLTPGLYVYYATDLAGRVSEIGTKWVRVETGTSVTSTMEPDNRSFKAYKVNDRIFVKPNNLEETYTIEIYSITGKLIFTKKSLQGEQYFNLDAKPGCTLIIKRISENNQVYSIRIIN